jgi:hypothetical protein
MSDIKAKPGSTRKEMTAEEKEWLKNFDKMHHGNDRNALKKLLPNDQVVNVDKVTEQMSEANNARNRDIYTHYKPIHADANDASIDEAISSSDITSVPRVETKTFSQPKQKVNRYTSYDYAPPPFPDENTLVLAIDHDNEQEQKKKIKPFPVSKRKKYDSAS